MRRVAGELDAVVGATETATSSILSGLEDIEAEANMLRASGMDSGNNDHVGAILDRRDQHVRGLQFPGSDGSAHLEDRQCAEISSRNVSTR